MEEQTLCVICAWRETCQKRFLKREGVSFRCPDFSKDVTIGKGEEKDDKGKNKSSAEGESKDL